TWMPITRCVARIRQKAASGDHATPDRFVRSQPRVRFAYPGYMLDHRSGCKARGRRSRLLRAANAHEDVDIGRAVAERHFLGLQVALVLDELTELREAIVARVERRTVLVHLRPHRRECRPAAITCSGRDRALKHRTQRL